MIAQAFRQMGVLLAVAMVPALIAGVVQWKHQTLTSGPRDEVAATTVTGWGDKVQWVDARPRAAFDKGHLPGAVLLNEDEWDGLVDGFLDAWEPEEFVVVYCDGGSCDESHAVARRLRGELKIDNVHVLQGGIKAWPGSR